MTVRVDDRDFRRRLVAAIERGLGQQGAYTQGAIQQKVGRSQPVKRSPSGRTRGLEPSRPGEPPRKITGELQRSIAWTVETDTSSVALFVGSNLPYARFLELGSSRMAARPFLRATLLERLNRIQAGVTEVIRRELAI